MFTGVTLVVPEYESSRMIISAQMCTGQRVVVVHHCVTVELLTPFFCVWDVGETLSASCGKVLCIYCKSVCPLSEECVCVYPPLLE